jgi:hypothetical protein
MNTRDSRHDEHPECPIAYQHIRYGIRFVGDPHYYEIEALANFMNSSENPKRHTHTPHQAPYSTIADIHQYPEMDDIYHPYPVKNSLCYIVNRITEATGRSPLTTDTSTNMREIVTSIETDNHHIPFAIQFLPAVFDAGFDNEAGNGMGILDLGILGGLAALGVIQNQAAQEEIAIRYANMIENFRNINFKRTLLDAMGFTFLMWAEGAFRDNAMQATTILAMAGFAACSFARIVDRNNNAPQLIQAANEEQEPENNRRTCFSRFKQRLYHFFLPAPAPVNQRDIVPQQRGPML